MKTTIAHAGLSLREARRLWLSLGGTAEIVNRHGEERFRHPKMQRCIVVNRRKTGVPRVLSLWLRRLQTGAEEIEE